MRPLTLLALLPLAVFAASNATCFYPNGVSDDQAFPCENGSPMCCPENHVCLDNGLCHNEADDHYFGRYSCTSKKWSDNEGCPKNCMDTRAGNEAVKQCSDGSWCCNGNNSGDCCLGDENSRTTFKFGAGNIFAVIKRGSAEATSGTLDVQPESTLPKQNGGSGSSTTLPTTLVGSPMLTSNTRPPTTPTSTLSFSIPARTSTSGGASVPTTTSSPPATAEGAAASKSPSTSSIVGMAVGVPIAFAALAVIGWFLYSRHRGRKNGPRHGTPLDFSPDAHEKSFAADGFIAPHDQHRMSKAPSEIDSREVRFPIKPQDTAHMASSNTDFYRDQTTNTLYPNAQPNYHSAVSPTLPTSTSSNFSHPSQDYSEWAVTPRLQQQQRWSGATAQEGAAGLSVESDGGSAGASGAQGDPAHAHELMGRPQIPPTIHELP